MEPPSEGKDLISELPDECLALILQRLVKRGDLKSCKLVSRKWLFLQRQNQHHLALSLAKINISSIPVLFSRFSSVTELVIRGGTNPKTTLSDKELELISITCSNLTTLTLLRMYYGDLTKVGMAALGTHATHLKRFSCEDCFFGAKPLNALLSHSFSLEEISIHDFSRYNMMHVYPGAAASSLKSISLKYLSGNPHQSFEPLIVGSKNLTSLGIYQCDGDWSDVLNMIGSREDNCLFEVYLSNVKVVSNIALSALWNFSELEVLHVVACYLPQSLDDEALILISTKCLKLTSFKLDGRCPLVTHVGMAALGMHAKRLKMFWCRNCKFGAKGLNALVSNSSSLREISVDGLHVNSTDRIYPCMLGSSLNSIQLEDLTNKHWPQCFAPLITGSKNLTSLRLLRCLGNCDKIFSMLANGENSLYEVYLNGVKVTDAGLSALSSFSKLEILHVIATPHCTNPGIVSVVKQCKLLRELHVEEQRMEKNRGEDGLISIGKYNAKLQVVKH